MALSSLQLARLVQTYVTGPGGSVEDKALRVGLRRNELLRAARGTIPRTVRRRLLAFFTAREATGPPRVRASGARPLRRERRREPS
jgi:hypothetical protein